MSEEPEDNVVQFTPYIVGDGAVIPCDEILDAAKGELTKAFVVGIDADGELYMAGSHGTAESVLMLERAKLFMLTHDTVRAWSPTD